MSLSFKTANIKSSTAFNITKEQIDAVLYPVVIVLTEDVVLVEDTGPVLGSTEEVTGSVVDDVFISDGVPPVDEDTVVSRGPWGEITVGDLQKEILDSFREGTYANPEVGGGKMSLEIITNGDFGTNTTGSSGENVGGGVGRGGRA